MATTLTVKGQVTIPKRIRDALGLKPGDGVDFAMNAEGQIVLRRARPVVVKKGDPDRFERALGTADIKWGSTDEYMKFVRGED